MTIIPTNLLNFAFGETWKWTFTADTPNDASLDGIELRWRLYDANKVYIEISTEDDILVINSDQRMVALIVTPSKQLALDIDLTLAGASLRHEMKLIFADESISIQCQGQFILRYSSFLMQNIAKARAIMDNFTAQGTVT